MRLTSRRSSPRAVPGVEHRRDTAARDNGADQPHGDVAGIIQASISASSLIAGAPISAWDCAIVRHGPAHAVDRFGRFHFGDGGGTLDVVGRDGAAGRIDGQQIDVEFVRERAHGGSTFTAARLRALLDGAPPLPVPAYLTHDRALIRLGAVVKSASGSPIWTMSPACRRSPSTRPKGRGHFHHRLVGLDRNQRLVGDHAIAGRDMPVDDFGLAAGLRRDRAA